MIGKAIHKILKNKITELNTGGIFPVVMPENSKYSISSNTNYPAIVYHNFTEYETSKDKDPNIIITRLMIQIISDSYDSVESINTKVRDSLDHYVDKSSLGLSNVPSYTNLGYTHNFVDNIDIQHIFYETEEDEYLEKLKLFTKRVEFDVYYYDDIIKLSYDKANTNNSALNITNPLLYSFDFTEIGLMRRGEDQLSRIIVDSGFASCPKWVYNKLGKTKMLKDTTSVQSVIDVNQYLKGEGLEANIPKYQETAGLKPNLFFENQNTLRADPSKIYMPYGCMFVLVYKLTASNDENYLLGGANQVSDASPIILSHKKDATSITIKFNPNGTSFTGASRERTLITSTNSTDFWDADYHFFCLSLGGSKNYTGGSVNQKGWFEYFNSNYNPKLTTGQIIQNNSITGNNDTMPSNENNFYFNRIGTATTGENSAGFRMFEMLLFLPNEKQTHNIDADSAPIQPTDIIYKKVKDYIYKKYDKLK